MVLRNALLFENDYFYTKPFNLESSIFYHCSMVLLNPYSLYPLSFPLPPTPSINIYVFSKIPRPPETTMFI
jgi:hypothetical protein